MNATPGPDAILRTLADATAAEVEGGRVWYRTAHVFAAGLARKYGLSSTTQAAYMIAALSPQQSWGSNQRSAVLLLETGSTYGLGANIAKARRILAGETIASVLDAKGGRSGHKVRAFGALIANPDDPETVCVDRHAADVALARPLHATPLSAGWITPKRYGIISDAYRLAADVTPYSPSQVQAITWLVRRNRKHPNNPYAYDL